MNIAIKDTEGDVVVRDVMLTAFFCKTTYPKAAKAFGAVFEQWLSRVPDDAKRWTIVGPDGEEYKPFTSKLLQRLRAELDPARAKSRAICSIELGGPQEVNPEYQFSFVGIRDPEGDETSVIEIRSPAAEAGAPNTERYVDFAKGVAQAIPFDSGYASHALVWGADSQQMEFAEAARKWAFRHPGFDVPDNHASNTAVGHKLRGAYWLTFVGPKALAKLGGEAALRKTLPRQVLVQPVGVGVMLRASELPEVGDVNRLDNLPTLRAMAKVLKPVTLLDDRFLDSNFVDEESRARWERRHLD